MSFIIKETYDSQDIELILNALRKALPGRSLTPVTKTSTNKNIIVYVNDERVLLVDTNVNFTTATPYLDDLRESGLPVDSIRLLDAQGNTPASCPFLRIYITSESYNELQNQEGDETKTTNGESTQHFTLSQKLTDREKEAVISSDSFLITVHLRCARNSALFEVGRFTSNETEIVNRGFSRGSYIQNISTVFAEQNIQLVGILVTVCDIDLIRLMEISKKLGMDQILITII